MKEIERQSTFTKIDIEYEAVDGTIFKSKDECVEYENTAKCVLKTRVQKLMTKEHNAWSLMGGLDDHQVVGIKFRNEEDIQTFMQYYCLLNPYYTSKNNPQAEEGFNKRYAKCEEAYKANDILLIGINCDKEIYIINTRQNIIDNLKNMENENYELR